MLAIIVAAQAGLFTVYTYVTPLLAEVSGCRPPAITALLAIYGIGGLAGNILGGWMADRAPWGSLCALLAGLATVLATFTLTSHQPWAATATMLLLGVLAAALIPLLQERGLAAAPLAPTLITAVCASALIHAEVRAADSAPCCSLRPGPDPSASRRPVGPGAPGVPDGAGLFDSRRSRRPARRVMFNGTT